MIRSIHVIPVEDIHVHSAKSTCWCFPIELEPVDFPGIFTHNAKDCREAKERVHGEKCSEGWEIVTEEPCAPAPVAP